MKNFSKVSASWKLVIIIVLMLGLGSVFVYETLKGAETGSKVDSWCNSSQNVVKAYYEVYEIEAKQDISDEEFYNMAEKTGTYVAEKPRQHYIKGTYLFSLSSYNTSSEEIQTEASARNLSIVEIQKMRTNYRPTSISGIFDFPKGNQFGVDRHDDITHNPSTDTSYIRVEPAETKKLVNFLNNINISEINKIPINAEVECS